MPATNRACPPTNLPSCENCAGGHGYWSRRTRSCVVVPRICRRRICRQKALPARERARRRRDPRRGAVSGMEALSSTGFHRGCFSWLLRQPRVRCHCLRSTLGEPRTAAGIQSLNAIVAGCTSRFISTSQPSLRSAPTTGDDRSIRPCRPSSAPQPWHYRMNPHESPPMPRPRSQPGSHRSEST